MENLLGMAEMVRRLQRLSGEGVTVMGSLPLPGMTSAAM